MDPDDNPILNPKSAAPAKHGKVVQPLSEKDRSDQPAAKATGADEAMNMLRRKIDALYGDDYGDGDDPAPKPSASLKPAEAKPAAPSTKTGSKHQKFMHELSTSGKSLAEIQTEWHNYYVALPDREKHEVWQEFYAQHSHNAAAARHAHDKPQPGEPHEEPKQPPRITHSPQTPVPPEAANHQAPAAIKSKLIKKVRHRSRAAKQPSRFKSLMFGLGMGTIVIVITMFSFFNERIITPFITPSRSVSNTPLIIDPLSTATVGPEPKIIIPKINVDIPVIFDEPSIEEDAVQRALEEGSLHYAITPKPGEIGNGAIFGHSSGNLFNRGKYKFAFSMLNRLEDGDTFMVHYKSQRYVYKVYKKHVVAPTEVSVLDPQEKPSTMTLITCDPPGSSLNRLVVVGEQISPEPTANVASSATSPPPADLKLPSDSPTLWQRLTGWIGS